MSHQGNIWDKEYNNPKFVTKNEEPQADTLRFFKYLKKEQKYKLEDKTILDLGCGTGRNSNYLAEKGNRVIGIEVSKSAIFLAKERARDLRVEVDYRLGDIGEPYEIEDSFIDVILDVTSSNSLNEKGRSVYLKEMHRVLKNDGFVFVRALCKDGDENVKNLLRQSPGEEHDTYKIKEIGLVERVFSKEDFIAMYGEFFKILKLEKKSNYTTFDGRIYKRNYWLAYMAKK